MDVPTKAPWQEEMAAADSLMMVGDSPLFKKHGVKAGTEPTAAILPLRWPSAVGRSNKPVGSRSEQRTRTQPSTTDALDQLDIMNDAVMIKIDSDCIWELKRRMNTTAEGCRHSCILVARPRGTSWGSLSSGEKSQPWLLSAPRWQVLYCISTLYTLELSKELRHGNKGSQENSHCDYGKNPLKLRPQQGSK